ncbi:MAG: dihydrolipoyl dehydrogenase [Oxalicibacterium faecigallinarum]|uniref:dihydrolipoyl dehydrogenase n=1 Tax=Oxalicibacterium faecigallinarum TaxID=573741 RepID=UPI002807DB0E|nr:dihydrolipoyl dehydrogenase [Oxalicibacterium faecigallinarum]MDQ7968119.1 dihydrolipoyl dehydrogenase [Oxalicibacterium faecigallinarum]
MKVIQCDVAVIGAGSAGLSAYRAARTHDKHVLLIEGGAYGTTCARVGCMPSKLLIAAAETAHAVATADGFGIHVADMQIDGKAVMQRVRSERDRFVGFVLESVDGIPEADRLRGQARFLAPNRLQVGDDVEVQAARIVIATGSRPAIPDGLRGLGTHLIVNDDVFDWEDLPDSVAVIGAGVIGLELGQALHRLGVRVAVFGRGDRLAQIADEAVNQKAIDSIGADIDLRMQTEVLSTQLVGDEVELQSRDANGKTRTERFRFVLAATGRRPNVDQLRLEVTGLQLDDKGIPLFDSLTMQCGESAIFLAGDVTNDRPLLHEAADEGRIAGDNAARFPEVADGLRRLPLSIAFTDPQIASVGKTARDLEQNSYMTGTVSFDNQGRSRVMRQNHGLLKLYGERGTHRFLGAEMVGPRAEHLAHLLAWSCQSGLTVGQMLDMPFYHPVIEEGVRTALRDLKENLLKQVNDIEHCSDCTPGI